MEALGWLWWLVAKIFGLAWGLVWFLVGGWVSALAQIAVIVLLIFGYKYGWRQAPQEILARSQAAGRYIWGWVRAREPRTTASSAATATPDDKKRRRRREPGDVNLSTLLSIVMLVEFATAVAI